MVCFSPALLGFVYNKEQTSLSQPNPTRIRDVFSLSVWAHFFSRTCAQKVLFGYLLEHFNVSHSALVDQNHVLCHFYWLCELLRVSNAVFMIEAEFPGVCVYMSNVLWKKTHSFWVVLC